MYYNVQQCQCLERPSMPCRSMPNNISQLVGEVEALSNQAKVLQVHVGTTMEIA
jgi:hypothetical protein